MTQQKFKITEYHVSLGKKGASEAATIGCHGERRHDGFTIFFHDKETLETAPPNKSRIDEHVLFGTMRVPSEQYPWFLDLLRNQWPVYAVVNSNPRQNGIEIDFMQVGWRE